MTTSTTFLGLGAMGRALAAAALAAGRPAVVWNRTAA
ncbi:NAD(P)-binding domain-containing protein, partial [Dactylosporangium sp. NPDC005572]